MDTWVVGGGREHVCDVVRGAREDHLGTSLDESGEEGGRVREGEGGREGGRGKEGGREEEGGWEGG